MRRGHAQALSLWQVLRVCRTAQAAAWHSAAMDWSQRDPGADDVVQIRVYIMRIRFYRWQKKPRRSLRKK